MTATLLRFPNPPAPGPDAFPYRVHAGDDTGKVIAWFHSFAPGVLEAMITRMDVTVVHAPTGRIVAAGGPILGQLQVAPDTATEGL